MVEAVLYPGLESHPGHAVARRQMTNGFGGMLSIKVRGGFGGRRQWQKGCACSCPPRPWAGSRAWPSTAPRWKGRTSVVSRNLLRLSAGIETAEDLIADLAQALDRLAVDRLAPATGHPQ